MTKLYISHCGLVWTCRNVNWDIGVQSCSQADTMGSQLRLEIWTLQPSLNVDGRKRFKKMYIHAKSVSWQLCVAVNGKPSSLYDTLNVAIWSVSRFILCAPLKSARHLMDLASKDALACNSKEYLWSVLKSPITHYWPLWDCVWNAPKEASVDR